MSQAVKAAMLATRDLGKNERLVALAIAAHTNTAGDAWPSVATIADYVGCSERTVQRCLLRLVQAGRLIVRKVSGIVTRVYRLVVAGVASATQGVTDQAAEVTDQAAGGDDHGCHPKWEDHREDVKPGPRAGGRLDWRRYIPRRESNPDSSRLPFPQRRGAALPPAPGGDRCQRPGHVGQLAGQCTPCRSEQLGGVR